MSGSIRQTLTEDRLRLLGQEVDELKHGLRLALSTPETTAGYQLIAGQPVFTGGITIGGQSIYAPYTVPAATGVHATWSASFDVISIDVTWSAPTGNGSDQVVSYVVQVQKHGSSSPPIEVPSSTTSAHIEPVEPNTTYDISVSASTKLNQLASPGVTTITTGGDTTPPAAPTFPTTNAVLPAINALAIKWNANTERDVANGAGQYRVVVSTNTGLTSPVYDGKVNGTTLYASPLVGGTAYYVGVYAIDSSGNQSPVGKPTGGPWTALTNVTDTSALAIGGGNIVKNSGFETPSPNGFDSWTADSGAWSIDTSISYGPFGTRSATVSASADAILHQDLPLSAGTWIISTWAKASSVAGAGSGVVLNWQLTAGTYNNDKVLMGGTASNVSRVVAGQGTFDWKRLAFQVTITSATATMRVYLQRGYGGVCTGQAWFDQIQAEQGNVMTAYAPRADEILSGTITTTQIADNSITTSKIVAGAIVAGKIAANTVGATEIAARSIVASNIATDTLTSNEIAAGAITANELAANSVSAASIQANSITSAQIAANTISASNLSVSLGLAVGQFIQSSNYVSNTTGWRVDGNGSGEFNNVNIRGVLHAAAFGGSPFDFVAYDGHTGLRIVAAGGNTQLQLGDQQNIGGYIGWDQGISRMSFEAGSSNSPAWHFTGDIGMSGILILDPGTIYSIVQDSDAIVQMRFVPSVGYAEIKYPQLPPIAGNNMTFNLGSTQMGYDSSSSRNKNSISDLADSGENNPIWNLRPRNFKWNDDVVKRSGLGSERVQTGFIAEEVFEVMPSAVHFDAEGQPAAMNDRAVLSYLTQAVQHLKERIDANTIS